MEGSLDIISVVVVDEQCEIYESNKKILRRWNKNRRRSVAKNFYDHSDNR
jgi:hypothetical protein